MSIANAEKKEGYDRLGESRKKKNQHFCFRHGEIKLRAGYLEDGYLKF